MKKVADVLYSQRQEAQEMQKEEAPSDIADTAPEEQICETLDLPPVVEEALISAETPTTNEQDTSPIALTLPISAPQLPSELATPLVPTPVLSPRPIQLRGSFIPTKHSPAKPQHEIYRVTTHVPSEKSDIISHNITDTSSSSHLPSQHDENRQTSLNSAHIDTSQLSHTPAVHMYQKGRKLKAKLPSYMQGMLNRESVPKKHTPSLTQYVVCDYCCCC